MTMFLAPYTAIADIDGSPLDAGFLFFGEYEKDPELFPVEVFWDADFTVPAAQPIRTRNGYPVRNGSPTKVYLKTAQHSIVIKNRNSAFILVDFKNKGWSADFVVYHGITQKKINDGLESIAEMLAVQNPVDGMRVYVKGYRKPTVLVEAIPFKGGGWFVYDQTKSSVNDTGMVINGWVRQLEVPPNPYHFGAYGDWNPTAQSGHDDSVPFQKCIDYILSNYTDFRGANSGRQLTLEIGNYLVGGLQFRGHAWSFRMVGQGMYTQLWHKKELGRHVVNLEYTYFENIYFNGAAKPAAETVDTVDYVFDFYLLNEALDIDTHFNNCWFLNCSTFARVDGRGFKTTNSMFGGKVALLEIYCDPNASFPAGSHDPAMQAYHSGMRHYVIDSLRVDGSPGLVKITGTGQQIDYINGLTISNCEITNCYKLVDAPTATLVEPKIVNNFGLLCFQSTRTYAAVVAKGIVDGIDSGNQWAVSKYRGEVVTDRARCLASMYRAETIDGLTLDTNVFKDLFLGVVRFTEKCNNLKIVTSTLDNFSPINNGGSMVWNESNDPTKATNILIDGNSITSATTGGVWMNNITGSSSFKAVNNTYPTTFADQRIPYNPSFLVNGAVAAGVIQDFNQSYYEIDGNYINVYIAKGIRSTPASGNIAYSLPVPAIAENASHSAYYSGSGQANRLSAFAQGSYNFLVNASSNQRADIQLNGANLDLSSKTGDLIQIIGSFRYRFK